MISKILDCTELSFFLKLALVELKWVLKNIQFGARWGFDDYSYLYKGLLVMPAQLSAQILSFLSHIAPHPAC